MSDHEVAKSLDIVDLLINRLDHLSADSFYAHRASGIRGSLIKHFEKIKNQPHLSTSDQKYLASLIKTEFVLLSNAAREIPDTDG